MTGPARFLALVVATVVVFAAGGFAVGRTLDENAPAGQELRVRPPTPQGGQFGSVRIESWEPINPGQDSYQVVFPGRRAPDIVPPPLARCDDLLDWAWQQGGVVLSRTWIRLTIRSDRGFHLDALTASVLSRKPLDGALLSCHFITHASANQPVTPAVDLTAADLYAGNDDRDAIFDEDTHDFLWTDYFPLDPGNCAPCTYRISARLRADPNPHEILLNEENGRPLTIAAPLRRTPDLVWCEEESVEDIDGDNVPETQLRPTTFQAVRTSHRCGDTPLRQ